MEHNPNKDYNNYLTPQTTTGLKHQQTKLQPQNEAENKKAKHS
jgi:hypothetical protein